MKIKKIQLEADQKKNGQKMILNNWVNHSINAQKKEHYQQAATPKRYLEVNHQLTLKMLKPTARKNK